MPWEKINQDFEYHTEVPASVKIVLNPGTKVLVPFKIWFAKEGRIKEQVWNREGYLVAIEGHILYYPNDQITVNVADLNPND